MIQENILVYYVVPSAILNKLTGFFLPVWQNFWAFLIICNHTHYPMLLFELSPI